MNVRPTTATPISCTAGTQVVCGASSVICSTIVLQAASGNTNNCYWGASGVTSTNGITLAPGEKIAITYDLAWGNNTFLNLGYFFLASDTTGNLVRVFYEQVN